jgi:hypothetical protein
MFTVVAKSDVEADLDWRLPVFEAGRYLLAFDGAALLLLELPFLPMGVRQLGRHSLL